MTLTDLLAALYSDLGYDAVPAVTTRLTRYLNEGHRHLLSMPELAPLRRGRIPCVSEPTRSVYGWPSAFVSVESVTDETRGVRLQRMPLDVVRTRDPQSTASGTPTHYIPLGYGPIQRDLFQTGIPQPAAPTVVNTGIGSGTYPAVPRDYAVLFYTDNGTTPRTVYSNQSAIVAFTPSGTGTAASISRPPLLNVGETHWAVLASADHETFHELTTLPIATTYIDDVILTTDYDTYPIVTLGGLWVVSSSAADTAQTVTLWGVDRQGRPRPPQTVTLAGQTQVQVGTETDYLAVQQWELSAPATGMVTLDENTAEPPLYHLGHIAIGDTSVQYERLRLWPTPSEVSTYQVDGPLVIRDLSRTYDVPLLPADFHALLTDFGRMREYEYRDDTRAAMAAAGFTQKLKALRDRIVDPPDYRPRVGRLPDRHTNLDGAGGVLYPPGRW
jgi:hypothetical protein